MEVLQNFLMAFVFSFLGSIPPGTLNLTVVQLGLEKKINIAWRFAIAVALIEYPYAWLAVTFDKFITSSPINLNSFKLISAIVMIVLGVFNLWSARKPSVLARKFHESGFRRGVLLGILNPLALPFWIGVTAYLSIQGWVEFSSLAHLHSYLFGVSVGALALLMLVTYTAKWMIPLVESNSKVKYIPGVVLLVLGLYGLVDYLF